MTLIASDLIAAGIGTSARNRSGILADSQSELLAVLNRLVMDLFFDASVINPFFIGSTETVAYDATAGGWPRPARALSVVRLEATPTTQPGLGNGVEILVIQPDNREAGQFEPHVLELGGVFLASGLASSPTGGPLRFWFARRPVPLTLNGGLAQAIDPLIPDDLEAYFVNGVGAYLALKDQRADEVPVLQGQRDAARALWGQMVGAATPALRRTFTPRSALNTSTEPTQ